MFKIHDDKVYFVAETPDINKVIEIFLPKDDRGTIMDSHEIRVDLCRAVIHMEKKGVRVLKVRNIEDTNKASIDIWHMPEYQEAAESPVSDVVNACIESCFDSGAMFNLPCKANRKPKNSSRTYHHAAAYPPWFRDVESRYKGNREPLLPESLPS